MTPFATNGSGDRRPEPYRRVTTPMNGGPIESNSDLTQPISQPVSGGPADAKREPEPEPALAIPSDATIVLPKVGRLTECRPDQRDEARRQPGNQMSLTATHTADLEPSLVYDQTYLTRRRPTYIDAAALLSLMTALIMLVPSRLIVPGMTDLGRPGLVVGFLLFCWWVLVRFSSHLVMTGPSRCAGRSSSSWSPC